MEQYILERLITSESLIVELVMAFSQLIIEMRSAGSILYISLAVAGVISAIVVWLIRFIAKNITDSYKPGIGFVIGSVLSYVTTFALVICLFSLQFTEPVVKVVIKGWELALAQDAVWRNSTFRDAYENVADLKTEDGLPVENFNGYSHPDLGGSTIPGRSDQARFTIIDTYLDSAADHFEKTMPILNWIISAKSGTAKSEIFKDMETYFKDSSTYAMNDAVTIAGDKISDELVGQVDRIIIIGTVLLLVIWLAFQTIIVGLISWSALRRIKENF